MNITVSNPSKSEITLTIELTEEQTEKYLNQAAAEVAKMVKIPGFRPGKAPREVLEKHVRPEALDSHMVDIALPPTYSEAILKEKIQAISRPKITILQLKPLKYEATVAVYPEVEVKGYDKIKVDIKDEPVKDEDVDQVLNEVKKQHATYKIVERPAKMGDRVEIDFQGFDEGGAHLEGTQSKNHPLILGDKSLIGGFEEELVGMKAEEKKKFKVTFPSDYFHKTFQDKKVEFEVQMNLVEEIEHPELNTEFFKKIVGEEKTLDQVKADIKENLETQKKQDNKVKRENEFLDKLADLTQLELPAILVEEEIHGMIDEFKHELENRGIIW
jgi:trigger factor